MIWSLKPIFLIQSQAVNIRGGSRTAATSKMELFVIIVNGLTIITKRSILDVAAVLDPPLISQISHLLYWNFPVGATLFTTFFRRYNNFTSFWIFSLLLSTRFSVAGPVSGPELSLPMSKEESCLKVFQVNFKVKKTQKWSEKNLES